MLFIRSENQTKVMEAETAETVDNNNARPPPSPGSTDTEEYDSWTVVNKGRHLKANIDKGGPDSPKITISRGTDESGEEEGEDQQQQKKTCQECVKNEKLLQTPQRQRHNSDSR